MPEITHYFPQSFAWWYRIAPERRRTISLSLVVADSVVIGSLFLCTVCMPEWWSSPLVAVLSCLAAALLLLTCFFPSGTERAPEKCA